MPEPFQKGNSAEYVREWERIFRGEKARNHCGSCGYYNYPEEVMSFPVPYCLYCGEKMEEEKDA